MAQVCIELLRRRIARGAVKLPIRGRRLAEDFDIEIDGVRLRCRMTDNYTEQMAIERAGRTNRAAINLIPSERAQNLPLSATAGPGSR